MRHYDEYRVRRVGKIVLTTTDPMDLARFQRAFFTGQPTYLNASGWSGDAYVCEIRLNNPMDGNHSADVVLQPTGAPKTLQTMSYAQQLRVPNGGMLQLDVRVTSEITREWRARIERILQTEVTRAAHEIHNQIDAYSNPPSESFNEWRRRIGTALSGYQPTSIIIDDPLTPYVSKEDCDEWYRRIAKTTGVPARILCGTEHTDYTLDLYARTQERARKLLNTFYNEKEKPMKKVRNPYYVAAPSVTTAREQDDVNDPKQGVQLSVSTGDRTGRWTRPTVEAAVEHATQLLDQNPTLEHVAIVKIVRVVRRKKTPVTVEVVK